MKLFIICGEQSGNDILCSVLELLKSQLQSKNITQELIIKGVVNNDIAIKFDIIQICDSKYFSVVGIGDILFKLPNFLDKINDIRNSIVDFQPDLIISIDSYELSIRIVKQTRKLLKKQHSDTQFWHIGAPSVWAYWKFRAKKIAKYYDHLFYYFPFEEQYFKPLEKHVNIYHHGFKCSFIGFHYAFQQIDNNIVKDNTQIGFMIGSRKKEIERHKDLILNTILKLKMLDSKYKFVIFSTTETFEMISQFFSSIKNLQIVCDEQEKIKKIQECILVVAKNGSNNIMVGVLNTAMISYYRTSMMTWLFIKFFAKNKYFNLINILLNGYYIPEFMQNKATSENLLNCIYYLLHNKEEINKQIIKNKHAILLMKSPTYYRPNEIIVQKILKLFEEKGYE